MAEKENTKNSYMGIGIFAVSLLVIFYLSLYLTFSLYGRDNLINRSIRPLFIKSPITKLMFGLDSYGDDRYDYRDSTNKVIVVEIDYQKGQIPDPNIVIWVEEMVQELLNKDVDIKINEDIDIPDLIQFDKKLLEEAFEKSKDYANLPGTDYLHILYITRTTQEEFYNKSAIAFADNEIVVQKDVLKSIKEQLREKSKESVKLIEEYTLKYSFGTLLGLPNVETYLEDYFNTNIKNDSLTHLTTVPYKCIMSDYVENLSTKYASNQQRLFAGELKYCGESKVNLKNM